MIIRTVSYIVCGAKVMSDVPEFPCFRGIMLNDKPLLDRLLTVMMPEISELTFTNLYAWNLFEPVQLSRLGETLLIKRTRLSDGKTFVLPPLGKQPLAEVLTALRTLSSAVNEVLSLYGVTRDQLLSLDTKALKIEPDRDDWDYVYLLSDLADLPGERYHPKRNFVARCLSNHECRYATIHASETKDCLQLQTEWCNLRDCRRVPGLEAENTAIRTVFENYDYLAVIGGAVYVEDKLEAFTLAERLSNDTAVVHFEKANPKFEGLYQLINQWFCQNALRGFKFVNREQDLGVPGLRKAKESYYPHHMVEKYVVHV